MSSTTTVPKRESSPSAAVQEKRLKLKNEAITKQPRSFLKIPIFIVDYHNDVLQFIYRSLASRHLPMANNVIVHFDSHPDMVISRDIKPSTVYDKDKLLNDVSIENWLMPTCYAGHFSKVIWIKNKWCDQIPVGDYEFSIGDRDDEIQVTLPIQYFLSEGNYCADKDLLHNKREMSLKVMNLEKSHENIIENDKQYILDIDLDFFSTSNPFLEVYNKANCYEKVQEIFNFDSNVENADRICKERRKQVENLKEIFEYLETYRDLNKFNWDSENIKIYEKICELVNEMKENYEEEDIDWMLVFNSGCTSDNGGLPHHISNESQIQKYMNNFEVFLKSLSKPPTAITIARSTEDDYCPKHQVAEIQANVLTILKSVFGDLVTSQPIHWYEDEEDWDIMKL